MKKIKKLYLFVLIKVVYMILQFSKIQPKNCQHHFVFFADSGYQGIVTYFKNSMTPKKKSKNNPLTDQDKELNKLISSIRISVEHVNCQLKIFRILSERYRSHINTFYLRFLLICSFYNFCL